MSRDPMAWVIALGASAHVAILLVLLWPMLGTPLVVRARLALDDAAGQVIAYHAEQGHWPAELAVVTNLSAMAFDGTSFQYDPIAHTLRLPADYEYNPVRLLTRGLFGMSETRGYFVVNLEELERLGATLRAPPDDFLWRLNLRPAGETAGAPSAVYEKLK